MLISSSVIYLCYIICFLYAIGFIFVFNDKLALVETTGGNMAIENSHHDKDQIQHDC